MRLLHTSDWHLGATLEDAPRAAEHRAFLAWLDATVRERRIEVLIVAGDVFQTMNPPADAQAMYYDFLAGLRDAPDLRKVVVVGGNHDSASRLDAPEPVLAALDVHVVGGWTSEAEARCICPVVGDSGGVELVVAAVPFVHEYRLGVRTSGRSPGDIQMDLRREFAALYERLARDARARHPDATLVATGHLTCVGAEAEDYATALHMVKTVGGFEPDIFARDYAYVALGHIHRMAAVDGDRVRYSGTPVPLSTREALSPRYVLEVDVARAGAAGTVGARSGGVAKVRPIEVPTFRRVVPLTGPIEEVIVGLRTLRWDGALEPYVVATVVSAERLPNATRQLHEALEDLPVDRRPRLVNVVERLLHSDRAELGPRLPTRPLAEMDPEEVFTALYRVRNEGRDVPPALRDAFRSLLSEPVD